MHTNEQAKAVREILGHGQGYRKVRVKKDGTVEYWGSLDPTDRQHDYWHYAGTVRELLDLLPS